ncbi:MAG TPA: DUF4365 domain-containing protein [Blastocatellia bacterium]|nr:DUF4365 domain-containing protein [Blastocatellia bacterium]
MHITQRKEQFSRAYIHAVASVAGYALYKPEVDDDSVDCGIAARGGQGTFRSPRLELQLKASSRDIIREDRIAFPLEIKNYNDLRVENVLVPRILVVVIVPEDINYWLIQNENEMCLKHCGYWMSLSGMKETRNKGTITVSLPRDRQFTAETLQKIMECIGRGEPL